MKLAQFCRVCFLSIAVCSSAAGVKRDLDYERLRASLNELKADPAFTGLAPTEVALADAAVVALLEVHGDAKVRNHLVYVAERRIDIAYAAAQEGDQKRKLAQLEREHDRILLDASRREAEQARLEMEKQRIQSLAQEEEVERLRAEAQTAWAQSAKDAEAARKESAQSKRVAEAQAHEAELARKEAQLAEAAAASLRARLGNLKATRVERGLQMTLDDIAFAPGQSELKPETRGHLNKLIQFVNQDKFKQIHIEGHTDSRGNTKANQALSQKRADAVKAALIAAGIDGKRIVSVGLGERQPVADNDSEEGRAKNRRVDVILESSD